MRSAYHKGRNENGVLKALESYFINIVDERYAYHNNKKRRKESRRGIAIPASEPIKIKAPLGWHPEKIDTLKTLHHHLYVRGFIICPYIEFEPHFFGTTTSKILWLGTQTELMHLIQELINQPLKLIPLPPKNNLNIVVFEHFRDLNGDLDPKNLKVAKSKGVGTKDRLDILDQIIEALK